MTATVGNVSSSGVGSVEVTAPSVEPDDYKHKPAAICLSPTWTKCIKHELFSVSQSATRVGHHLNYTDSGF